jgi:hypothetical protein
MTRNLKVTFCTAAISTSSFVRPGDLGYSAAIPAVAMLWWSLAKTIWQSLPRSWRDPYRPELHTCAGPDQNGARSIPAGLSKVLSISEHDRADSAGANHRLYR